jgi:hypothetical protein
MWRRRKFIILGYLIFFSTGAGLVVISNTDLPKPSTTQTKPLVLLKNTIIGLLIVVGLNALMILYRVGFMILKDIIWNG